AVMEWWDQRPGLRWVLWRSEPLVVIVSPDHRLADRCEISKAELATLDLLGGEPGTGTAHLLDIYFEPSAARPRVSRRLGSTEAVKQAVKAGLGISLVLQAAVTEEIATGSLRALRVNPPELRKELFIIWRDDRAVRPFAAPAFVEHLTGSARARS